MQSLNKSELLTAMLSKLQTQILKKCLLVSKNLQIQQKHNSLG
jgi:hypothetical protein